jgi:hypothetical protein
LTLLALQRSYTRSAEMISVPTDALRILTDVSGTTPSPDTLRGLAISTHTFAPALETCSGVVPRIAIYSPGVSNTLRGHASHWHVFVRCWQHAWGLRLTLAFIQLALATHLEAAPRIGIYLPGVSNTLGGCASHWHLFARRWQHARGLRLALAFLYSPNVGNTLRGFAFQPDASNTLRGYTYMLTLAFILLVPGVSNTLGGCALCY